MTSPLHGDDRPSWRQVWLPAMLILGSPWLAAAVTLAVAKIISSLHSPLGHEVIELVGGMNLLLAVVGSAYGGFSAGGPYATRVAVVIATIVYGATTYLVVLAVAEAAGVRFR